MEPIGFACACGRAVYHLDADACARCAARPPRPRLDWLVILIWICAASFAVALGLVVAASGWARLPRRGAEAIGKDESPDPPAPIHDDSPPSTKTLLPPYKKVPAPLRSAM